ncbi:hypothetical protein [Streptomyces sp. NPDC047009]
MPKSNVTPPLDREAKRRLPKSRSADLIDTLRISAPKGSAMGDRTC